MVGAIPGDAVMHERPVGRGYVHLRETAAMPWPGRAAGDGAAPVRGHEFHHSSLEQPAAPALAFAYRVQRGHGIDGRHDGVLVHNLLASYTHLRSAAGSQLGGRFVALRARCPAAARASGGARCAGAERLNGRAKAMMRDTQRFVLAGDRAIPTDSEGYLLQPGATGRRTSRRPWRARKACS